MSAPQDSTQSTGSSSSSSSSSSVNVNQVKAQLTNKFQANKPLVLKLHSILTWEQDSYPIMVSALVTLTFLVIYLMNSSFLTTLSYLGILAALIDLAMPIIVKNLCGSSSSTAKLSDKDNQRFDKICTDLAKVYAFFRESCNLCCSLKTSKPKLYYPSILGALFVLAFIGNKINNLFLTYLVALFVALYPGLERKGLIQKAVEFVYTKLGRRSPFSSSSSSGDRKSSSGKRN